MEPLLSVNCIEFTYDQQQQPTLHQVSFTIPKGRKIALMGANGSGKSTLFLCLNGIHRPQKGELRLNGEPFDYSKKGLLNLRSRIGIVFQDPESQLFTSDVRQEIAFGPLNLQWSQADVKIAVATVIEKLKMHDFIDQPTHALSGGQKKLVAIADILVMQPELMILDEPMAALDATNQRQVRDVIDQIAQAGITVMISSHDIDEVFRWADEVILIDNGRIIGQGSPIELFCQPELLAKIGARPPHVLTMYQQLISKGVLNDKGTIPRTIQNLLELLR